jgi:hypothetical protein
MRVGDKKTLLLEASEVKTFAFVQLGYMQV